MSEHNAERWNARYRQLNRDSPDGGEQPRACAVLRDNSHLLPGRGRALDVACGRGGNALLLAQAGLETHAWDYADAALSQLDAFAASRSIAISTSCRDVSRHPPSAASFDIIVVSRFLDRALLPYLVDALRSGGLLYYQTFIREAAGPHGPRNPAYRLEPNELLQLCGKLRLVFYREEGGLGYPDRDLQDEAQFIGYRPGRQPQS